MGLSPGEEVERGAVPDDVAGLAAQDQSACFFAPFLGDVVGTEARETEQSVFDGSDAAFGLALPPASQQVVVTPDQEEAVARCDAIERSAEPAIGEIERLLGVPSGDRSGLAGGPSGRVVPFSRSSLVAEFVHLAAHVLFGQRRHGVREFLQRPESLGDRPGLVHLPIPGGMTNRLGPDRVESVEHGGVALVMIERTGIRPSGLIDQGADAAGAKGGDEAHARVIAPFAAVSVAQRSISAELNASVTTCVGVSPHPGRRFAARPGSLPGSVHSGPRASPNSYSQRRYFHV